jgi:biopolymer transport protein ExbD
MAVQIHHGDGDLTEAHEINVTPFIDVMLVLLIIFMVAAPLATVDLPVDLPVSTAQEKPQPDQTVILTIRADHSLALGDNPVARDHLGAVLDGLTHDDKDERVFVRADKTVDYDTLMQIMNALRAAGYLKVALVGLESDASQ